MYTLGQKNSTLKPDVPEFIPKQLDNHNGLSTVMSILSECNITFNEDEHAINSSVEQGNESTPGHFASSTQTGNFNKNTMDADDLKLVAAKLIENEYLQERIKTLEAQIKAQEEEAKVKDRIQVKLEIQLEELEKSVVKLEYNSTKNQRTIKYLESSLMEQCTRFLSSEKHRTAKHISKCNNMITDLKLALHYLTPNSAPSVEDCQRSIHEWETQLRIEKNYSQTIEEYSRFVFNALQNDENLPYLNQPHSHMDINDLRDILHDNYIPTITHFIVKRNQTQPDNSMVYPVAPPLMWYGRNPQQFAMVPRPNNNATLEGVPMYLQSPIPPRVNFPNPNINRGPNQNERSLGQPGKVNNNLYKANDDDSVIIETVEHIESEQTLETEKESETQLKLEEMIDEPQNDKSLSQISTKEEVSLGKTDEVLEVHTTHKLVSNKKNDCEEETLVKSPKANKSEEETVINETKLCSESDTKSVNLNKLLKNKDDSQLPVQPIGRPKFAGLFEYIRQRIINVSDQELLFALKKVREKKAKLSGMTKEKILTAVNEELQNTSGSNSLADGNQQSEHSQCICAICLFPYEQTNKVLLKCDHSFHQECIKTWFKTNSICPICRLHAVPDDEFKS